MTPDNTVTCHHFNSSSGSSAPAIRTTPTLLPARLGHRRPDGVQFHGVAAIVAAILGTAASLAVAPAHAATAPTAPQTQSNLSSAQTSQTLKEVVVTATALKTTQLNASYNVVVANYHLIQDSGNYSTAGLLKLAPGIWPETSGGQTGANVEIAGYPSSSDTPFFSTMIEGMPVYGTSSVAYEESTSLFRIDDTIKNVQIVQGGPSVIFGDGVFGGAANFVLKNGQSNPGGRMSMTYGTQGMWRLDGYDGFKIADGWYGSVGGYYRVSNGVRNSQFPAIRGGQFTATLKHDIHDGSVLAWARFLDESDQFITDYPLIDNNGSYSAYPGFNPLTGTYNGLDNQIITIPNQVTGGFQTANLANGRGDRLYYFGIKYQQHLGSWHLMDDFIFDGGHNNTNAWFSGPNPRPLSMFLYACNMSEPTGWCNGSKPVDANNLGPSGTGYPVTQDIQAQYAGTATDVPLSANVAEQSYHLIRMTLQNITDEFQVSRTIFKGDILTGGIYGSYYSDNANWTASQGLMTATSNAQMINLSYVQNGHTYHISSPQGILNDNNSYTTPGRVGVGRKIALYLSDNWQNGPWLINAGARLEHLNEHERTCNTTAEQLGSVYDLFDNAVPICNGTYVDKHYQRTMPTYTFGVNYDFSGHMSAYFRWNNGVLFPNFDSIAGVTRFPPIETAHNYEIGYKFQNRFLFADLTVFHRTFGGLFYQESTLTGVPISNEFSTYGSVSTGIELNGYFGPFDGFALRYVGDYVHGYYRNNHSCLPFINITGTAGCASINGAPLARQPSIQFRVTPTYTFLVPWGDVSTWITIEHVGQRYDGEYGTQPLGVYNMLSGGLLTNVGHHWTVRLQGTNLTNTIALTEGNAREFGAALGVGNVILGRAYPGREVRITAVYKF